MSDTSFSSILDQPMSETERPKPLPAGTYYCMVDGQPRIDKTTRKGTEFTEFSLKPMQAMEDVDEKALLAALKSGDGSSKPLSDKRLRVTFYNTEDAKWRLKKFLVDDLKITMGKKKYSQAIAEATNRPVLAHVVHVPSQDGQTVYANVDVTAPVEE